MNIDDFYVVAKEPGAEHPALPTWANDDSNPAKLLESADRTISRREIPEVPGAFQILNVLTPEECQRLIDISESLGYLEDAAVSLPRSVRHNMSLTWVVDEATDRIIWQRSQAFMTDPDGIFNGKQPLGINARFRFYRYDEGDFFKPHIDGDWPGSRVIDRQLVSDAYPDRWSKMTFLVLLSEDFDGGATQFWVNKDDPRKPAHYEQEATKISVRTPAGSILCFPHGRHPMHCLHSSEKITQGTKYIIRSDVLFEV